MFPDYLKISAAELGEGTNVKVIVKTDMASIGQAVADDMLCEILAAKKQGREATLIVPVGPVDQYALLAATINQRKISLRDVCFINMDEYLTDDDKWIPAEHPLSFRGYMDRLFYNVLEPSLAPRPENRIFPHPENCGAIQKVVDARGGVDATFGGIGINGHIAFNEPPEPGEKVSTEQFANLPTRVLSLTRETRTVNSVTVGGEITIIPRRCVTVGMKEILASRGLYLYCNRVWQSAVARRALHGPITPACPASLMKTHSATVLTVADYVAAPPDIRLR